MVVLVNRAKVATATTGTGTITLGAAESGYQTFAGAGVADADVVRYVVEDGTDWEIGTGTYNTTGTTLSRTVTESSNADSAISLSGSATVFVGATAADFAGGGGLQDLTFSNYATPIVNRYYDNSPHPSGTAGQSVPADRVHLGPFASAYDMRVNLIGALVLSGTAGGLIRCIVYSSDADGWPDTLLFEGASSLDASTFGYVSHSTDFTFTAGVKYWVGVHTSATTSFRVASSPINLGLTAGNRNLYVSAISNRSVPFASGAPATFAFVSGDTWEGTVPVSIRMRARSL